MVGEIIKFATREATVLILVSQQKCSSRKCRSIEDFCDIGKDPAVYKYIRPSQIILPKKLVSNVVEYYVEYYVNPFGVNVDIDHLVCLDSSVQVKEEDAGTYCLCPI